MSAITESDACRWLGRRVSLLAHAPDPPLTGRLQHVSSRNAFLLQENVRSALFGGTIRLIPLSKIERIVPVANEDSAP
jgi:hypothetical protein